MKITPELFVWFFIITPLFFYFVMWDGLLEEIIQQENAMDNFCILNGYNKSTGSHSNHPIFNRGMKVECDKSAIFNFGMQKECIKINKWGECKEDDYVVNRLVRETGDSDE